MSSIILPAFSFQNRDYPIKVLQRKNNRHLRLSIDNNGQIRLSAPLHIRRKQLLDFLYAHQDWIQEKLKNILEIKDEHDFLGASLQLQAFLGRGSSLNGAILRLGVKNFEEKTVSAALHTWYNQQTLKKYQPSPYLHHHSLITTSNGLFTRNQTKSLGLL